jgi:hypothetical protein
MFNALSLLVNTTADAIVKGNWTFVLVVVAVCLAVVFVVNGFNNGYTGENNGILGSAIFAGLLVFSCVVLFKLARNDDLHHPERYVGHTYELASIIVPAASTEQGIYAYETERARIRRDTGVMAFVPFSTEQNLGIVNLADTYTQLVKWTPRSSQTTRLTAIASSKGSSESPLVEVRAENNAYAGRLFWIPARLLSERDCRMAK